MQDSFCLWRQRGGRADVHLHFCWVGGQIQTGIKGFLPLGRLVVLFVAVLVDGAAQVTRQLLITPHEDRRVQLKVSLSLSLSLSEL